MRDEVLDALDRATLVDAAGLTYLALKPTLVPRWGRVWLDIAAGWMAIALCAWGLVWLSGRSLAGDAALAAGGALAFGFLIAHLHLFLHEGAHFNLHPDRARNDTLCNLAVSGFIGLDVRQYRPVHWDHHRYLATEQDTEITYFDPLDVRFLVQGLTGWRVLKALTTRRRAARAEPTESASGRGVLVLGALANALALAGTAWSGQWVLAIAWVGGMLVFFPFFGGLRQLLEHRDQARDGPLARRAAHRLFGNGAFARWFGAAGFNRHLLHHWEPQISYTRLRELERYLRGTQAAGLLASRTTSYARVFRVLFRVSA